MDEMDLRFKQELLGKGYVTKVFSTKVETIYKTFQRNRNYVVEANRNIERMPSRWGKLIDGLTRCGIGQITIREQP